MPAPVENGKRLEIVKRHEAGETLRSISGHMGMSYETVKRLWQHWRKTGRIEPNYEQARQRGTRKYQHVLETAVGMKRDHPRWGAELIRLKLGQAGYHPLPTARTLQRWFREAGVQRSASSRQAGAKGVVRGQEAHAVWAVDAKEQIKLADGTWASWLVVSDEGSGAILWTEAFSPAPVDDGERQPGPDQLAGGV